MYVTKRNMANAVSNLTKHLEHVSEALAVSVVLYALQSVIYREKSVRMARVIVLLILLMTFDKCTCALHILVEDLIYYLR